MIVSDPAKVDLTVGKREREVIAFECSYTYDRDTTQPIITWQICNTDNTFMDVPKADEKFSASDIRAGHPIYEFFQTNFTGYFQILNSTDLAYNGTRYRCKATSGIPGDTQEVYSNCATVRQHDASMYVCGYICI